MQNENTRFDLQLFAEGGAGDGGGASAAAPATAGAAQTGQAATGENQGDAAPVYRSKRRNPFADVKYGVQQEAAQQDDAAKMAQQNGEQTGNQDPGSAEPAKDTGEEPNFEQLVGKGGKFEKDYNSSVQAIVQSRLKNAKQTEANVRKIAPLLATLGDRYGIDASDISSLDVEALAQKIDEDTSLYEEEAEKEGLPVETVARLKKLERAEKTAKMQEAAIAEEERQHEEEERQRAYWSDLVAQGEQLKQVYPNFDFDNEMQTNQRFRAFMNIRNPATNQALMSVREAYQTCHQDEILGGAMQYAAQATQQKLATSIQSGQQRPAENGTSGQAVDVRNDPSRLKKSDFDEILRRKRSGENIVF